MKVKTSQLIGPALDWAVAKCESETLSQSGFAFQIKVYGCLQRPHLGNWKPSSLWSQGGPILERESIDVVKVGTRQWRADCGSACHGPTPLVAAMRAYVVKKWGHEVDVPDELMGT